MVRAFAEPGGPGGIDFPLLERTPGISRIEGLVAVAGYAAQETVLPGGVTGTAWFSPLDDAGLTYGTRAGQHLIDTVLLKEVPSW